MRYAAGSKAQAREGPHFNRMVDQFIIVARSVSAKSSVCRSRPRQTGCHLPGAVARRRRRINLHRTVSILLPQYSQKHTGAVEKTVGGIQMRAAHRKIPCVDLVVDNQRTVRGRRLPGVLVQLRKAKCTAAGLRANRHDMPCEFANHVAAGNPRRQRKALAFDIRFGDYTAH